MDRSLSRRVALSAAVISGVVLAHGIAYALAYPDPHTLRGHLAATGHSNWRLVATIAVGAAMLAAGLWVLAGMRASAPAPHGSLGIRLFAAQGVGLVALETLERFLSGTAAPWTEPAFWIAIPVMAATSFLALGALRFAHRLGRALSERRRITRARKRTAFPVPIPHADPFLQPRAANVFMRRGPPLPVAG